MKKKSKITAVIAILMLLAGILGACGKAGGGYADHSSTASYANEAAYAPEAVGDDYWDEDYVMAEEPAEAEGSGFVTAGDIPNPSAKMVYTANVQIQTLEYEESLSKVLKAITACGGFIESQEESNKDYYWYRPEVSNSDRYASIVARVPSSGFQSFVDGLEGIGQITSKSINAENITQRYYDTEATIEALTIERDRLLAMMDKAETIEDMIAVESRLTEVERSLSSYKTDLSSMDKSVEFSTVYVYLDEVEEYHEEPPQTFGQRLRYSIGDSWDTFKSGMQDLAIALVYLLPFLILIAAVVIVIVLLIHRFAKKHPERAERRRARREEKKQARLLKKQQKLERKGKQPPTDGTPTDGTPTDGIPTAPPQEGDPRNG